MHRRGAVIVAALSLSALQAAPGAGQQLPVQEALARLGERVQLQGTGTRSACVVGFAWTASNEPVRDVEVRLRNLLSGAIDARARTTDTGEFLFCDLGDGTYVVELMDQRGRMAALGAPFTLAAGTTVATFVRLALAGPSYAAALTSTAAAAVVAAAGLGIAAVAPAAQSASADR